jgi:hypothetical protein
MFEDSTWIDAVHSCSHARGYRWNATAEVEDFSAESYVSHFGFLTGGHPLRGVLAVLSELRSTKIVRECGVRSTIKKVWSVYDYPLEALLHVPNVNDVVEQELTSVLLWRCRRFTWLGFK